MCGGVLAANAHLTIIRVDLFTGILFELAKEFISKLLYLV